MKHAIVSLVIILFVVLLVLPLMFIAFGKLKNPIDLFAMNKVATSVSSNTFVSPNYVPDPNSGQAPATNAFAEVQKEMDTCFKKMDVIDAAAFTYVSATGTKSKIVNNQTGASWVVADFTFTPTEDISKSSNYAYFITQAVSPVCVNDPTTSSKISQLFGAYADSNQYINTIYDPKKYEDSNNFDLVEQGVSIISGRQYHWYSFEDKNRFTATKYQEKLYQVVFVTYDDSTKRVQNFTMQGSSFIFSSSRDFLRRSEVLLSGLTYGTYTASSTPVTPAGGVLQQGAR